MIEKLRECSCSDPSQCRFLRVFNSRLDRQTIEDFFSANPKAIPCGDHRGCILDGKTIVSTAFDCDGEFGVMTINSPGFRNNGLATKATKELLSETGNSDLEFYIEPSNPNGRYIQKLVNGFGFKRKRV